MKYLPFIVLLTVMSCNANEDPKPLEVATLQEPSRNLDPPANSMATTTGTFTGYAHSLSGKAVIYVGQDNTRTLRLEEFTMTSGPDVYVLLSKTNNYSSANTIPIAMLKDSYTNTNLTLTLDNSIDLTTHKFVLVYCVKFSSLFGFSELK